MTEERAGAGTGPGPSGLGPGAGQNGEDELDATVVAPRARIAAEGAGPAGASAEPAEPAAPAAPVEPVAPDDATIVAARPPRSAGPAPVGDDDGTIVVARPPRSDQTPQQDQAPQPDQTSRSAPIGEDSGRSTRSGTANPAPPIEEPSAGQLPADVVARMFKSPLDAKLRIPDAPTPPEEHTLPRRGVAPGIPVLSPVRSLSEADASQGGTLSERFGPPPASVPEPLSAERDGLRSTARANRRFGLGTIIGLGVAVVVSVLGLWGVAVLAFG